MIQDTDLYAQQNAAETLKALNVDAGHGLSDAEAQLRLIRYGPNEVDEKDEPAAMDEKFHEFTTAS